MGLRRTSGTVDAFALCMRQSIEDPIELPEELSRSYLLNYGVCPHSVDAHGTLVIACTSLPLDFVQADLSLAFERRTEAMLVSQRELEQLVERLTSAHHSATDSETNEAALGGDVADARQLASEPPVVRYVNLILQDAHQSGASDIHLEATRGGLAARYRIDGVLVPAQSIAPEFESATISRVKMLADLDIAEHRRPQDGRFRIKLESRELDLRVSAVPTLFGESIVIRLLEHGGRPVELSEIGMSAGMLNEVRTLARRPHGLFVVTGPTGSGKSTTLYSALACRDAEREKIITVEDPIEFQLRGITQVPVNRAVGVTFSTALRSLLRQDPDVLMIGELRDEETAEMAVQAAMTGHLVLTTLHTNDAFGAIPRLVDLGVPAYLVAGTLDGVLAQRLVRRTCDSCRVDYRPPAAVVAALSNGASIEFVSTRGAG